MGDRMTLQETYGWWKRRPMLPERLGIIHDFSTARAQRIARQSGPKASFQITQRLLGCRHVCAVEPSKVCHLNSVRCFFDFVECQLRTLGSRGIYNELVDVKGNDVPAYTERFQELTLICTKFVANETEKVDKYISGLPDNIYGNLKQSANKRKADDSSRNNHGHQQQPFKRQNVTRSIIWGQTKGSLIGDLFPSAPSAISTTKARAPRGATSKGNGTTPKGNGCFEYGAPGHFKRDCLKLKTIDGGNRNAQGWVYAVGNAEKRGNASGNPDSNVVTGTFLLNNHYASILFDTGVDRSFISTAFSSLIDIETSSQLH
ncbi:putative reverse transcriptase domain-containing protein [Tanacetum coccineum]